MNLLLAKRVATPHVTSTENKAFLFRDRLFIKVQDRVVRIFLYDVLWVEAFDYYSKIITRHKGYLVTQTLKKLDDVLSVSPEMMRVHRSYMVNLKHIDEVGELFITINEQVLPISRVAKKELVARWQKI